jgi:hypothetical protein
MFLSIDFKKLVIDALKPREISLAELAKSHLQHRLRGGRYDKVAETDMRTETVRMILAGTGICYDDVLRCSTRTALP